MPDARGLVTREDIESRWAWSRLQFYDRLTESEMRERRLYEPLPVYAPLGVEFPDRGKKNDA